MQIEDGRGSGRKAEVTSLFQLATRSVAIHAIAYNTLVNGATWTVPFDAIDPAGADDYFLYIRNDNSVDLVLGKLSVSSTVAGFIEVQKVTGTPAGGTDVVPVARNIGSLKQPNATIQTGTDITGLSSGGVLEFITLEANIGTGSTTNIATLTDDPIVIPRDSAIAFLWTVSTGVLTGNVTLIERAITL